MTGMADGAPPAPSGSALAPVVASAQSLALSAGVEPIFQPSREQQHLLQQARAHAASLALQSAQRRDQAALAGDPNAHSSALAATKLQQRAAAAAQALGSERKVSAREIQAMLEKNEAALRMWNVLHRQQPPLHQQVDHREWLKKCYLYRQQVGARLEVLASLADKQIAQEDDKSQALTANKKTPASTPTSKAKPSGTSKPKASRKSPVSVNTAPAAATAPASNASATLSSAYRAGPGQTTSGVQAQLFGAYGSTGAAAGGVFPSSGMINTASTTVNPSTRSGAATVSAAMPVNSAAAMPQAQSSAFEPTAFTPTSASTAPAYMNQAQNFMMNPATMAMDAMGGVPTGNGMMSTQQFMMMQMQMPMGMNMGMYAQPNMFGNANYNMMSGGSNPLPMDPFNASLSGFGQPAMGFPSSQPSMNGAYGMPGNMQGAQMMNQMGGGYPSMMPNGFQYGTSMAPGMTSSTQGVNAQPQQQQQQHRSQSFQSGPAANAQLYQPLQQQQQPPNTSGSALLPDAVLFDDDDDMSVNLFEGFPDDTFLPLQ